MHTKHPGITIKRAEEGSEKEEGRLLIERLYTKYYGVLPSVPDTLFLAVQEGRVVGTTVVEFVGADGRLPLENLYEIQSGSTPWPLVSSEGAQWSRLTGAAPFARAAVTFGVAEFALQQGKNFALAEAKEQPVARHQADGLILHPVVGARLRMERVEDAVRNYYTSPPPPVLYMMRLIEVRDSYGSVLSRAHVPITLDF